MWFKNMKALTAEESPMGKGHPDEAFGWTPINKCGATYLFVSFFTK